MIRISRRLPKNSMRQWRAAAMHPASADARLLRPELVAGPYVLLADAPVPLRDSRPLSFRKAIGISA
jgi:hypothetical protein